MSTKLAKARLAAAATRQAAKDTKASTKSLKAENRKLRNSLIKIAEMHAGEEAGGIAWRPLITMTIDTQPNCFSSNAPRWHKDSFQADPLAMRNSASAAYLFCKPLGHAEASEHFAQKPEPESVSTTSA